MITAGIDAGLESVKVVIIKDGQIIAKSSGLSGGAGRAEVIDTLYAKALAEAGIAKDDVEKVVATGAGKFDASIASETVTEPIADAKSAGFYLHDATSIVDIGADQMRVTTLDGADKIVEIALNQKCSAGIGTFLKYTAGRFGLGLEGLSALSAGSAGDAVVNDGCIVFAELDALELLNKNVPKEQVAAAIVEAMAVRANMVLNDKIVPAKKTTVLIGGVAKNNAFVQALKARSNIDFVIPEDAEYGGAVGCALIAAA